MSEVLNGEGLNSEEDSPRHIGVQNVPPQTKKSLVLRLWELLQPFARFWGLLTAIVMSGAGAELVMLNYEIAPGIIVGAICVLILETMWVAALFVDLLCRRGEYSPALRCWDWTRWCCGRARAPLYACAATAILLAHLTRFANIAAFAGRWSQLLQMASSECIANDVIWLCSFNKNQIWGERSSIAILMKFLLGGMLLTLAALRALVPFSPYATHGVHSPRAGSSLLSQIDPPVPDVFYNVGQSHDDRLEEMTVLNTKSSERPSRSRTPRPPLLEI